MRKDNRVSKTRSFPAIAKGSAWCRDWAAASATQPQGAELTGFLRNYI